MKIRFSKGIVGLALVLAVCAAAPPFSAAAGAPQAGDIDYTMPPGWVAQAVQGGPEIKAHYTYLSAGRPYGEMYLSQQAVAAGLSLDQVFQEGLAKIKPNLPYYQARGTQKADLGGVPVIVHEFVYMPAGAGVMFVARTYTLVSGGSVFTFFFQTLTDYFSSMQGVFTQVMASVRPAPSPAPQTTIPTQFPAITPPGGLTTVDDMGLSFELPAGWSASNDPAGAKYRQHDAAGSLLSSLLVYKPDPMAGMEVILGASIASALDATLKTKIESEFKKYDRYSALGTNKRKIGGYDGLVHDLTFETQGRSVSYRWCVFAMPQKSDSPTTIVAPVIQSFAFMTMAVNRANELRRGWEVILDSMRPKGTPAPLPGPAVEIKPPAAEVRPKDVDAGGLPELVESGPEAGFYPDPFGRFKVRLPAGVAHVKTEENAATFKMPAPGTTFIIHSYRQEETGIRLAGRFAEGRKLNGAPSTMTVSGREAAVSLYTGANAAGENMAWVVALYPKSGLLIVVNLPAREYIGAKEWISSLVRGVSF